MIHYKLDDKRRIDNVADVWRDVFDPGEDKSRT
jgi:hypothetical protein